MPFSRTTYQLLTFGVLICLCSSTAIASFGVVQRSSNAPTGCFPSFDSVEGGELVGDVVDVEMLLCFTGSVTIEGPGYRGNATLGDGHHSGHVTLHLNTAVNDSAVFNVTSDPLDSVPMNATANGSFKSGTYTITYRDGSGDLVDTATFELNDSQFQKTSISGSLTTTSDQVTTNGNGGVHSGTSGVPGFTVLTTLIALIGLAVLWTWRF